MKASGTGEGWSRRGLLAAMPACLAAACAPRADPDALRFWAMSYQGDYAPLLMPAFTRATGIAVDVQSVPWTAAHEKLLTAHVGGALPDVFMLPNGWVGEFAMIGALAPVPSQALFADLMPGLLEPGDAQGRRHAVPWSVAPRVQFFRRDLLAAVGWEAPASDWGGWRRMGRALKRRRPDDFVFMMLLNWPDDLLTMLTQLGAPKLREHATRGNFRTPEAREAFGYYKSLFDDGLAPKALSTEVQDQFAAFAAGQFAIWNSGPTTLLDFRRRRGELSPERWGTARIAGPRGPGPISVRDVSLCVSAGSRRPADAWRLLAHVTSAASELRFAHLIGSLPARAAAWPHLTFPPAIIAPFAEQARVIVSEPSIVETEQIRDEVALFSERAVRGLMTIDEALAGLDQRVDAILAKRRALVQAGRLA